jgi:N-acetylglucosamine kinase-like BadF-type ATPase
VGHFYLGVDGGQSSTTALIGDSAGRVIGYGRAGPCNHVGGAEGRTKFTSAIVGCVSAACAQAGLGFADVRFESACLGFSGGPADKEPILREILDCSRMIVTHDASIALAGATAGEPGLIVIAGTGSIAFGRNGAGKTARAGGWGYIFGDEGGGFDIARQALRAALRHEEGWGPPTALREMLLQETGSSGANEALHRLYTSEFPRPRIASLAKAVDRIAAEGDAVAIRILETAAHQLATLAGAVRGQLFGPNEPAQVACIGGVFRSVRVLERFRVLVELDPANRLAPPVYGPAAGALIEAYRAANADVSLSGVPEVEKQ